MVVPILKWAGGKRWLISSERFSAPISYRRYIEPFLGSAAVFFHLEPHEAILSDLNEGLINLYKQVRDCPNDLHDLMVVHQQCHSKSYYYEVREREISDGIEGASNFLYLNRTCWNGLFRVNLNGKFNVPIGTKEKVLMSTDDFQSISNILKNASIRCCDFESVIDEAGEDDFVFVDPPYTVKHNLNGFVKYNENIFKWSDQIRLRDALVRAKQRGAIIFVTNADHQTVRELYDGQFCYEALGRHSVLSGASTFRKQTTEAFFTCNFN